MKMKKYKTNKLNMDEAIRFVRAANSIVGNNYILDGIDKASLFNSKTEKFFDYCLGASINLVDALLEYELSIMAFKFQGADLDIKGRERDAFVADDRQSGVYVKIFPTYGKGGWANPTVIVHASKDEDGNTLEAYFLEKFLPKFKEGYFREWEARME